MRVWASVKQGVVDLLDFCNCLDDATHRLSPVKVNLWSANLAGALTSTAAFWAFVTAHWAMLSHAVDLGSIVGPYLAGSHAAHFADKGQRNRTAVELATVSHEPAARQG